MKQKFDLTIMPLAIDKIIDNKKAVGGGLTFRSVPPSVVYPGETLGSPSNSSSTLKLRYLGIMFFGLDACYLVEGFKSG